VDQHGVQFPRGFMLEEREALRIAALCALGRIGEATPLRQRFEAQNAHSPWHMSIVTHCDR
jgi:uncharacterized protein with HEPN domain